MTKKIEFADGLSLPEDAATQTIACIARKRAGKSYAAGKIIEGLHANGSQFVVLDPVGNWYGLRIAADGKAAGIDVVILGGLRGDIPLDPSAGSFVADTVLDSGRSFVLDVSQFSLGERKRFVQAFGERLWLRQKGLEDPQPIHVVLEEAQLFVPQNPQPEERPMLGIWCEIVRLGGNKGIGVTIISQRPQSVSKEALTQVECLVVLQVNGVPEKKALKEWIVEQLDTEIKTEGGEVKKSLDLLKELPFLKQGVAYVWSPQWLGHFGQHKVLPKWTYDASATPKVGAKKVKAQLKPIDLEKLREQMATTVQKLEENDPKALKKKVATLETALKKIANSPQTVVQVQTSEPKIVEVPVLKEKELKLLEKHQEKATVLVHALVQTAQSIVSELGTLSEAMKLRFAVPQPKIAIKVPPPPPRPSTNGHANGHAKVAIAYKPPPPKPRATFKASEEGDQRLAKGAREMLRALACRHPTPLSRGQVATLAGISPRSSTFRNYSSILRVADFMNEDGSGMHITEKGLEYLGDDVPAQPTTTEELMSLWSSKFTGKVNEMLRVLVESHPSSLSKEQLGEKVGILPETSTFRNYLSMLRSNELVETSAGAIRASDTLFPN